MALTKIDDRGLKTPIDLLDDEKIRFGTGNDLDLYHTSGVNYIQTHNNSNLEIKHGSDVSIKCTADGSVELYRDGAKKFETTSSGVSVTGVLGFANTGQCISLGDNKELHFGTGDDLQFSHNGSNSNSYIKNTGTGELIIESAAGGVRFNSSSNATGLLFNPNTSIELFYDNSKKFETYSAGVEVTGNLYIRDGSVTDNRIALGTSGDFNIYHDGSDSYLIDSNAASDLFINSNKDLTLKIGDGAGGYHTAMYADNNGAVRLYYDNVKTFQTGGDGITVYGPEGGNATLRLSADEGDDNADLWKWQAKAAGGIQLENYASGSWEDNIVAYGNGAVELYYDNAKIFETTTSGVKVTSGGNTPQIDYIGASSNALGRIDCDAISGTTSNMRFYVETGGSIAEKLRIQTGGGISFNGDTAAANGLDDYEEGTFTITVGTGGDAPTISGTSSWTGQYTKIGKVVHVNGYIASVNVTAVGTSITKISGLPFASAGDYSAISITHNTLTAHACEGGYVVPNQTYFYPIQPHSTSGSALTTGFKFMMFAGTYLTAA